MWEQNELDPLNFNDASNIPPWAGNGLSIRHAGVPSWWTLSNPDSPNAISNLPGGAVIGTFGGAAQLVKWKRSWQIINKDTIPNEIFNGPVYQR